MSLRAHLPVIAHLDHRCPAIAYLLRVHFALPSSPPLIVALSSSSHDQADLVLALLRISSAPNLSATLVTRARSVIAALVGHPIIICPPYQRSITFYSNSSRSRSRSPIITYVQPDPPLRRSTGIADAYREFRLGRTRQQLLCRGVSRGDIRRATRRGWIKFSVPVSSCQNSGVPS